MPYIEILSAFAQYKRGFRSSGDIHGTHSFAFYGCKAALNIFLKELSDLAFDFVT